MTLSIASFDKAVHHVLDNEGGLSTHENDHGGITNMGISHRFLKSLDPDSLKRYGIYTDPNEKETIINLTKEQAIAIYRGEFWEHAPFEAIANQEYCNYIFDMAVNMGIANAIKCVQRATWAVMRRPSELLDDGILGTKTIAAIAYCGFFLMAPLRAERAAYYRSLIAHDVTQKDFLHGWYDRTYRK